MPEGRPGGKRISKARPKKKRFTKRLAKSFWKDSKQTEQVQK